MSLTAHRPPASWLSIVVVGYAMAAVMVVLLWAGFARRLILMPHAPKPSPTFGTAVRTTNDQGQGLCSAIVRTSIMSKLAGLWLPIITPFADGVIDVQSYESLLEHYLGQGVAGIFPLGTTGEAPTIDDEEVERIVDLTMRVVAGRVPVFVGIGGNATRKVIKVLKRLERYPFAGLVSVCPYYNRPSQDGLREHFVRIAEATDRKILIYNIPYRTSINLANETLLRLAEIPNIVGVKDSSGNLAQSLELLRVRPNGFSVLTGEEALFYTMLAHGGDGGILASAHLETTRFIEVYERMAANDHQAARVRWSQLETLAPLLFKEANPMPIKYCLWRQGLIKSAECRLPLTQVSAALAGELDHMLGLEHTLRSNGWRGVRELRDNIDQASHLRSVGLPQSSLLK
jgi:4-hydroxy-tetrahydrodipicolinate synthase